MTDSNDSNEALAFSRNAMTAFLQIGALALLMMWCFSIVVPFVGLMAWGLIIAVTMYPLHLAFAGMLGGRYKRSAVLLVVLGLALLITPTWVTLDSSIDSAREIADDLEGGSVSIPRPPATVAEWPIVGERIYAIWNGASENLQETLNRFESQLATAGKAVLRSLGNTLLGVLQFAASIILAGILLVVGEGGYRFSCAFAERIVGPRGRAFVDLSVATVRSVTKGVIGVAFVQTALAVLGLVVMDVPGAGIWGAIIMVIAVMQLPPWLILAPIAIWVFSVAEPVPATIFAIYSLVVSISDMFLKPMFLGRGVDVPMPVILIGAIGGALTAGLIGLFVGAVVLAIGYELLMAWIYPDARQQEADGAEGAA